MGVPKDKLIVGLATYGMSFTLVDPHQHGVHAPARGGGRMGKYTKETGILAYYEVTGEGIRILRWFANYYEVTRKGIIVLDSFAYCEAI